MKLKYINWEKVDPGTIFGIKYTYINSSSDLENYKYYYYFIKYDNILNELVFYNVLDQHLERFIIKSNYANDIDFDIFSGSYFDKPKYKYLKGKLSKNYCYIFKDSILKGKNKINYEFLKITKLKENTCDLESISKGFKLRNIDINSITSASKIFKIKKENLEIDNFIKLERIDCKSRNFNLIIKIDKYHRNIFVLVYNNISRKYSIESFKPDILINEHRIILDYANLIFNNCIDEKINNCIDSIENGYPIFIPDKGYKYKRLNYKTNEEEEVKFDLKNISCFYDLYFENLFDKDQEIKKYEKESIKNYINSSSIFYK